MGQQQQQLKRNFDGTSIGSLVPSVCPSGSLLVIGYFPSFVQVLSLCPSHITWVFLAWIPAMCRISQQAVLLRVCDSVRGVLQSYHPRLKRRTYCVPFLGNHVDRSPILLCQG